MTRLLLTAALLLFGTTAQAQSTAVLSVTLERDGVPVPYWRLQLDNNGAGTFQQRPKDLPFETRNIQIAPATWARMQRLLADTHNLTPCETKTKGLARVGQKTVDYIANGATAHCSFNYTDNKPLSALADMWNGLASTLTEARRLTQLHKHDRLGLDKELADYEHAVDQGFAIDPSLIQPELQAILADEALMERVRRRAQHLLELKPKQ